MSYYQTSNSYSPLESYMSLNQIGGPYSPQTPTAAFNSLYPNTASSLSSSVSSNSSASTSSSRARFNASRSFDQEDDMEFCPEIGFYPPSTYSKFNPYTSSTFSPTSSPTEKIATTPASLARPKTRSTLPGSSGARTNKPLEIVNPVTGLRVASPSTGAK
ncbi:Hypothetical protein PP7435_CHR4-0848 [Komagataella phaffii CBS 7435]|uniref:Uncharacterized protein n=1 Tax=Komagataella phaffii (strain ATCC 76273 / CBS 7435 / CECT 11047 / NRRL Y-11430 / Wegner 21-1) TaxID=981350 RepID=A0A1G4KQY7_KOMPC|nr:Hypothetical protein BQ9382_C4-4440 [Komagataella phaffii CBS 7435]SCV12419.1 Hypothetical protein PP7435_CHR4-0848 [Komagataella phaffii CBS 7435]